MHTDESIGIFYHIGLYLRRGGPSTKRTKCNITVINIFLLISVSFSGLHYSLYRFLFNCPLQECYTFINDLYPSVTFILAPFYLRISVFFQLYLIWLLQGFCNINSTISITKGDHIAQVRNMVSFIFHSPNINILSFALIFNLSICSFSIC